MKWFRHDSDSHIDTKIKKLKNKYGITGYGLYWYCLELIAGKISRNNITFVLEDDAEVIAIDWGLDQLKVQEIMTYMVELGLFENNEGNITCLKLALRLDDTNSRNPEIKNILASLGKAELNTNTPKTSEDFRSGFGQTRLDDTRKEEIIKKIKPIPLIKDAEEVIKFLNEKAKKNFQVRTPNGKPTANALKVIDRLKEGYTVQQCKTVITRKTRDWQAEDKMTQYLTPETLFRKSKFDKYHGECVAL